MLHSKISLPLCLLAALAISSTTGCGDSSTNATDAATDSESSTTAGPGGSSTSSAGSDGDSATTSSATTSTTSPTTDPTTATTAPVDPCEDVTMRLDPGNECQLDCECALIKTISPDGMEPWELDYDSDGKCFLVPLLGGSCSECVSADDCADGGCTIPNPLASTPAYCNDGGAGDGCDADGPNTCQDPLICGTVLDAAGILTVSTCGECAESADCTDPMLPNCAPTLDVVGFTGEMTCVADATIPQDSACVIGEGVACESGICSVAVVMGIIQVGICGECDADNPCADPQTCTDAFVNIDVSPDMPEDALKGSICE